MGLRFEWDRRKAGTNLEKHGVSFDEASTVFHDPLARIFDDQDHSEQETREIIVGTRPPAASFWCPSRNRRRM